MTKTHFKASTICIDYRKQLLAYPTCVVHMVDAGEEYFSSNSIKITGE